MKSGWHLEDDEVDCTVFVGVGEGEGVSHRVSLVDYRDSVTGYTSMSRTTGFMAAGMAVQLASSGKISGGGVLPPEHIVNHEESLKGLVSLPAERDVVYNGLEELISKQ